MSNITLTIPNDDHIALRAFGKALEEMALAYGAEPRKTVGELSYKLNIDTSEALERLRVATEELQQAAPRMMQELRCEGEELHGKRKEPEVDTTAQQVESLATVKPFEERLELLDKALSKETPESLAEKLQSYNLGPTTDSTGTPWDERIHSTSKALNVDGTWRLRRKPKDMDELEWSDYVSMIKADLQYPVECGGEKEESAGGDSEKNEQNSNENNNITPAEIEPPVTPPGDDFHTDADVVTEQTVAGIPPLPVPPPVVVAPPVTEQWDFPRLMTFLTERHGKIDVATVNTLLAQDGMSSVQELNAHPDKIGPFVARVKAHLGE
ncbi:hypothetical protein AXX01_00036 [Acinetobacter phage LAPP1]|nr:hypothetical protein AXX01_00036 [Acinetobacter phage JC1]